MRMIALTALLLGTACNIPPKDPYAAAERALRRNDLLRALQAYDAVPVAHARYPDARAAAGDVEQRMRRCHELILEALMLRSEWRDSEALEALQRARQHWPQQPNLNRWIAATEKRMQLFAERGAPTTTPASPMPSSPMVEVAKIGSPQVPVASQPDGSQAANTESIESPAVAPPGSVPASQPVSQQAPVSPQPSNVRPVVVRGPVEVPAVNVPQPMLPEVPNKSGAQNQEVAAGQPTASTPKQRKVAPDTVLSNSVGNDSNGGAAATAKSDAAQPGAAKPSESAAATKPKRLPTGEDPVALGLVAVEARLGRGELALAVRDLIELSRRFSDDVRVNRRLSRLLHQRALMSYGQGSVAAAVTDWRRVLEIEPGNRVVQKLLDRALAESRDQKKT